jgi:type IV pilus assembly protein PilE
MQERASYCAFAPLAPLVVRVRVLMLVSMKRTLNGSSLLEMLTAVAVLATVAAVAMPGYRRHLLRAQRTDATTFLLQVYAAQQKFFIQYGRYVVLTEDLPKTPAAGGLGLSTTSEFGEYRVTLSATDSGYRATANRIAGATDDPDCAQFSIDESGLRQAVDAVGIDHTAECFG